MSGFRRAAIALHGVAADDRASILHALPETDRVKLQELLDELASLGFDNGVCANFAGQRDAAETPLRQEVTESTLEGVGAARMQAVLAPEADALIAAVLAVKQWPWRDDFLAALSGSRRERILACKVQPGPARDAALIDGLTQRLKQGEFGRAQGGGQPGKMPHGQTPVSKAGQWTLPWKR